MRGRADVFSDLRIAPPWLRIATIPRRPAKESLNEWEASRPIEDDGTDAASRRTELYTLFRSRLTLIGGLLFLPLLGGTAGAATIPITGCGTISQPGNYHLTQDLQATTFLCIVVTSNNVEIHLDGYTIHGTGKGILVSNAANVSITGSGRIEANVVGINVLGVNGITITGVTVSVSIDAVAGIYLLEGTANATLINNTLSTYPGNGATGSFGIVLSANDSIIRSNTVSGFGAGVVVAGSGSLIQANTASGNRLDFGTSEPCGSNTWKGNKFTTSSGCLR